MIRIVEHYHVKKTKTCWLWMGGKNLKGYGNYGYKQNKKAKTARVHRLAYSQEVGPIPEGMCVLHKCDVRNCLRPEHLFIGTIQDNVDDMCRKGRHRGNHKGKTHCINGHEFTKENTGYRKDSPGWRFCRACKNKRETSRRGNSR